MKQDNTIENKINKALGSIDSISPATLSSFFYRKVLQRLEKPKETLADKWSSLLVRPTVAFVTLLFILILNAFVILHNMKDLKTGPDQNNLAITDEYSQATNPSFYLENPKP